jgi:hypothetical protein
MSADIATINVSPVVVAAPALQFGDQDIGNVRRLAWDVHAIIAMVADPIRYACSIAGHGLAWAEWRIYAPSCPTCRPAIRDLDERHLYRSAAKSEHLLSSHVLVNGSTKRCARPTHAGVVDVNGRIGLSCCTVFDTCVRRASSFGDATEGT